MAKNIIYRITVTNWEKHNGKKKRGQPHFFLENTFFMDAKIRLLSNSEKLVFVGLLSSCGDVSKKLCECSRDVLQMFAGGQGHDITRILRRLESLQLVSIEEIPLIKDNIKENKRIYRSSLEQARPLPSVAEFDFLKIYENYPRKAGRSRGLKACERLIRTSEEFEQLAMAVANYRAHVEAERPEPRFIKHFSTFIGEWKDWLEPGHGSSIPLGRTDAAERERALFT